MAELKVSETEVDSDSESYLEGVKQIIDVETSVTNGTTKVQPSKPKKLEEGECLFHSQMWVKEALLHFIVDISSQRNLISAKLVKRLGLPMTSHPYPYTIEWLRQALMTFFIKSREKITATIIS
jgi:hypothetical protein